ncbi:helix-turn-helix transcriptional regulator [Candidatus Gracilibacteria bacterium]|nr:helix-turn-helix transcriptional regulator [Candidatus Gracilibacteria bacterium]
MSRSPDGHTRRWRDVDVEREIAHRVREVRLARAVTQEELATVLGVRRESMSRYESGERAISLVLLLDIAAALEQPITAFLPGHTTTTMPDTDLARVMTLLEARPDLIPSVLDLLAVLHEEAS